jgi:hypothetical protein
MKSNQVQIPDRAAQIETRLEGIPPKYRKLYLKATDGNRPAAVRCQCLECCGWAKADVTGCSDLACPLYAVRPFQKPHGAP